MTINYFNEDVEFELEDSKGTSNWIEQVVGNYNTDFQLVNYIFCSDEHLLSINKEYLNHDYYTDIITFDLTDVDGQPKEADIFISIDRVKENAKEADQNFERELHRVIIHGILHLIGFKDKTDEEAKTMREMEEKSLSLHAQF